MVGSGRCGREGIPSLGPLREQVPHARGARLVRQLPHRTQQLVVLLRQGAICHDGRPGVSEEALLKTHVLSQPTTPQGPKFDRPQGSWRWDHAVARLPVEAGECRVAVPRDDIMREEGRSMGERYEEEQERAWSRPPFPRHFPRNLYILVRNWSSF